MKRKRPYEQAQGLRAQLGTATFSVVRRHVFPLTADEHGSSLGAQVDNLMFEAVKESDGHGVVQSVTLHLFDEQLDVVADYYSGEEQ